MKHFTPRVNRINQFLDSFGTGDPEDIGLSEIEKELIVPRYQEYMVATELCLPKAEALINCMENRARILCIFSRVSFTRCVKAHDQLKVYKDRYLDEYIELRKNYRLTKDEKYIQELRCKTSGSHPYSLL